ncbi:MAG: YdeI/OmpD-associated family protein [Oleispira sp.]
MAIVDDKLIQAFETSESFYEWLRLNHKTETELWLKLYKKGSGIQSIDWNDAVKVALCWGWIDGIKKSVDSECYVQRVTPRRAKSIWSKRNTEHVEALIEQGLMQPAGLTLVEAAKADGRWQAAYSTSDGLVMPEDFLAAVESSSVNNSNDKRSTKDFFSTLSKSSRNIIVHGLQSAKKEETRKKRFDKFLAMLDDNIKPK